MKKIETTIGTASPVKFDDGTAGFQVTHEVDGEPVLSGLINHCGACGEVGDFGNQEFELCELSEEHRAILQSVVDKNQFNDGGRPIEVAGFTPTPIPGI